MKKIEYYISAGFFGIALALFASALLTLKISYQETASDNLKPAPFSINAKNRRLKPEVNLFNVQLNREVQTVQPVQGQNEKLQRFLVLGIINSGRQSAAIIKNESGDSVLTFKLGEKIFNSSEYLVKVEYDAVILARNGGRRKLYLGVLPDEEKPIQDRTDIPSSGTAISRSEINASVKVAEEILGQTKLLPEIRGNIIIGFKVTEVGDNTIVKKMGILQGDIIKSVNGNTLDSLERSAQVWQQMKSASELHMVIEREGKDSTMSFYLKP